MTEFLDALLSLTRTARDFMWGQWMIVLLVGTGVILTLATRGIQIRKFILSMKFVFTGAMGKDKSEDAEGDISPFAALMTALAATVGNGNIAGVATAIATGGPGAPFWMWVSAFFGMATKYAEGFLGVKYRKVSEDGTMAGGPMYYARDGIKNKRFGKILGMTFAVCGGATALFGTGNMAQSNSIALAVQTQFGVPTVISALVLTIFVGLVIIGGIKRIGAVSEKLVPAMIAMYFLGAIIILIVKVDQLWDAFMLVVQCAFSLEAAGGALVGTSVQRAISLGVSRGVLSNEAGLGSAAIAQSAAKSPDPGYNGLLAMTGTFIDSIFVNSITTFIIIVTGVWKLTPAAGHLLSEDGITSTELTIAAFNEVIPFGGVIIALASFLFGYSTLLGWAYYGERCIGYIWGVRSIMPYRFVFIGLLFVGGIIHGSHIDIVWYIGDVFNAIMAFPNLIALLALTGVVARITTDYYKRDKFEEFI